MTKIDTSINGKIIDDELKKIENAHLVTTNIKQSGGKTWCGKKQVEWANKHSYIIPPKPIYEIDKANEWCKNILNKHFNSEKSKLYEKFENCAGQVLLNKNELFHIQSYLRKCDGCISTSEFIYPYFWGNESEEEIMEKLEKVRKEGKHLYGEYNFKMPTIDLKKPIFLDQSTIGKQIISFCPSPAMAEAYQKNPAYLGLSRKDMQSLNDILFSEKEFIKLNKEHFKPNYFLWLNI